MVIARPGIMPRAELAEENHAGGSRTWVLLDHTTFDEAEAVQFTEPWSPNHAYIAVWVEGTDDDQHGLGTFPQSTCAKGGVFVSGIDGPTITVNALDPVATPTCCSGATGGCFDYSRGDYSSGGFGKLTFALASRLCRNHRGTRGSIARFRVYQAPPTLCCLYRWRGIGQRLPRLCTIWRAVGGSEYDRAFHGIRPRLACRQLVCR